MPMILLFYRLLRKESDEMMKSKVFTILIFFLVSLPLVGCQLGPKHATDKEKNYQLAIFDVNKILTFEENDGRLKQLETIARNKELSYWKEGFFCGGW